MRRGASDCESRSLGHLSSDSKSGANTVTAGGVGNIATNVGGAGNTVQAAGGFNKAISLGGNKNTVKAFNPIDINDPLKLSTFGFNSAFNAFGSGNTVTAGPGPFANAGSFGQTGKSVTQKTPGIKINRP